ncbi:MAG TPA: amidohydrolase family protein [Flavobacteriales bacterium]
MEHRFCSILLPGLLVGTLHAQVTTPINGPHDRAAVVVAFTHATLHPAPGEVMRDATLVISDDRIVAVGPRVDAPRNAIVYDLKGAHVWPGLIEPYSDLGLTGKAGEEKTARTGARYWNRAIDATSDAVRLFTPDADRTKALRAEGFTTVVTHRMDGIARGTGCALSLAGRGPAQDVRLPRASAHFSFRKGSSPDAYPSSLMGSIALLRQVMYDARWYSASGHREQSDTELQALNDQLDLPLVFEAEGRDNILRAARIAQEFGLSFIVKGAGDEYGRLADILATRQPLIVPLSLPEAFDVEDPFEALEVPLSDLKHWELAASNAARIAEADGVFTFTTHGLKELPEVWPNLRRMVRAGLDTADAIAALTTVPAKLFRLEEQVGRLKPGMRADLIISSAHLLDPRNVIQETWADGQRTVHRQREAQVLAGRYDLNIGGVVLKLTVKGGDKPSAELRTVSGDTTSVKVDLRSTAPVVTLWFEGQRFGYPGPVRLNGVVHERGGIWDGQGLLPGEQWVPWNAVRERSKGGDRERNKPDALDSLWSAPSGVVWYPMSAFGRTTLPDTQTVIFRRATVWTNGPEGILRQTDVCIHEGRVFAVGKDLRKEQLFPKGHVDVLEVDATGKHLTSGIIDEHSHIAISRGVNEGSHSVTSEVRVSDVIDPDAVDIHRSLAGGVTAVQQLHGSANSIGGQSSLIKLRHGRDAEGLRIAGAEGTIKFALGENVKQSNWGIAGSRFPQTRMGVEQVFQDAFRRAKEYAREWSTYDGLKPKEKAATAAPRRDLQLDALVEILEGKRHITCHSYVRSEILMLLRVADSLGFRVNTFTHVLEGYKVAGPIQAHGTNASTFSDWWAYKFEVADAIPYNAALLHAQGVNTCINSDDAEMGRRLNQEAAKTIKYGGVPAEEAWKMVTLNPAKALHLDARMGSLEKGKDADLVLWSADPLSIDAKVEMTFVDGVRYYDAAETAQQEALVRAERARIIAKMLVAKRNGAATRKPQARQRRQWECETIGEEP